MTPLGAGILGLILGVLVTALVLVTLMARRGGPAAPAQLPGVGLFETVLPHVRGAVALIGGHDEVVSASPAAHASGLVRGSRLAVPAVLDEVRRARTDQDLGNVDIDIPRGGTAAPHVFAVRVVPLPAGHLAVLADDRTVALRLDETRRDFVANITHELKTPIGAMSLLAEATEAAAAEPERVQHFAQRLGREAARLNELVSQIIALSRLQSSDPLLAADPVRLDDVITAALERCHELAEKRRVSITTTSAGPLETWGDAEQVETAVVNLVQNAIAYSEQGARVAIATRTGVDADEPYVEVAVSDNGIGISADDQTRVFERFFRVDYGRSREHGGTGLGLSLVKHIAEAHGGSVSVWSSPGHGSTFTLRLPAHQGPGEERR